MLLPTGQQTSSTRPHADPRGLHPRGSARRRASARGVNASECARYGASALRTITIWAASMLARAPATPAAPGLCRVWITTWSPGLSSAIVAGFPPASCT
jgi:hypothetical protein